jgi:carbamoyl-phosphate synthase large subunit
VTPRADRIDWVRSALLSGWSVAQVHEATRIDPWFLDQLLELVEHERLLAARAGGGIETLDAGFLLATKRLGYSDRQIAAACPRPTTEWDVRSRRHQLGVRPVYKLVDTCAAEFESYTPYYYSTYEQEDETRLPDGQPIIIVLGGGPNRIGQGIEFDYCCVHASMALRERGFCTVMINSNPETVSTDFDTSDMLFFEPLTHEDVMNVVERLEPRGLIVQFGGQTPLNLARGLQAAGAPLIGTSVDSIDRAEDRDLFAQLLRELELRQPANGMARTLDEAIGTANRIGYPIVVRPSFVLGGRAMEIVYDDAAMTRYMQRHAELARERPFLVDKYVEGAIEVDVDAIADGETVVIGGIMEHIEEAGIHSGDSSCSLPPYTMSEGLIEEIADATRRMARALGVVGLMNVQYAVRGAQVFVLEANPRASRTVPFVAKAIGRPLAKYAARVMAGEKLKTLRLTDEIVPEYFCVKAPVFPFNRFHGVDTLLGPEMKSTGEVMGIDRNFGAAFAKAQIGAGNDLPQGGKVFLSVRDEDKRLLLSLANRLHALGFEILATRGTARALVNSGVPAQLVFKIHEGRPHVLDLIKNQAIGLIVNTPLGRIERSDDRLIRSTAVTMKVPCITTMAAAAATIQALETMRRAPLQVRPLQEYHAAMAR